MVGFFAILGLSILWIVLIWFGFDRTQSLSSDYWSDKQEKAFRLICCAIGLPFLLTIILVCIFSTERFSFAMNKVELIIMLFELLAMVIFSQIIHFIAWKKKENILEQSIKEMLRENESISDKRQLLKICIKENRINFSQKQIERKFNKIFKKYQ